LSFRGASPSIILTLIEFAGRRRPPFWYSRSRVIVAKVLALMPAAAARSIGANEGGIGAVGSDDDARAGGQRKREQQNDWAGFQCDPHGLGRPKSAPILAHNFGLGKRCGQSAEHTGARHVAAQTELLGNCRSGQPPTRPERPSRSGVADTKSECRACSNRPRREDAIGARLADRPQIYVPSPRKFLTCQNKYCGLGPNIAMEVSRSRAGGEGTESTDPTSPLTRPVGWPSAGRGCPARHFIPPRPLQFDAASCAPSAFLTRHQHGAGHRDDGRRYLFPFSAIISASRGSA
jgi:hypothetical protein